MKKPIFIAVAIGALSFAGFAHAANLEQTGFASSTTCSPSGAGGAVQVLGSGLYGTVSAGVQIYFTPCTSGNYGVVMELAEPGFGGVVISETLNTDFVAGVPVLYSFGTAAYFTLNADRFYTIGVSSASTSAAISVNGSLSISSYPNGAADHSTPGYENGVADLYFSIPGVGYTPSQATATGTVSIVKPENGGTTYEFDFFDVQATTTLPERQLVGVRFSASSSVNLDEATNWVQVMNKTTRESTSTGALVYEDFTQENDKDGTFETFVYKIPTLVTNRNQEKVWYFKAYVYDDAGNIVASSSPIAAFVKYSTTNVTTPTSTPTSTAYFFIEHVCPDVSFFDPVGSFQAVGCNIQNWIRGLANEIFHGSEVLMNNFIATIQKGFPLNIFKHLSNDFNIAKANRQAFVDVDMTFPNGFRATYLSSSTPDYIVAKIGIDYRNILDYIVYAVTGGLMLLGAVVVFKKAIG